MGIILQYLRIKLLRRLIQLRKRGKEIPFSESLHYLREYFYARSLFKNNPNVADHLILYPILGERTATTKFDSHYFYQDVWAFNHVNKARLNKHVDVGSRVIFVGFLSCITEVEFIDIRPLEAKLKNLTCREGTVSSLPYEDDSIESLSCLHVVEHIGLGRYGDPLDIINGTRNACLELQRVLKRDGVLYLGLPIGSINSIEFNAHRVHTVDRVLSYFPNLILLELSGVTDKGEFIENINPELLGEQKYGCGLFRFTK